VPFQCLIILPLALKHRGHLVDSVESGGVVLPENYLFVIWSAPAHLEHLLKPPLRWQSPNHITACRESQTVIFTPKMLLSS
jgi:hypothetical protein